MSLEKKLEAGKGDLLYSEILIKGKNISVREILRQLAQGNSVQEIFEKNPELTQEDLITCYEYAYELIGAIEFKKGMSLINIVIKKREAFVAKLRGMKINRPE
ncbi:DUF433 domain-containing protein [Flavobacterium sp.]|jgi:uncharacterized protein (DUF433 family)|uniref:DUF433 domain-containing protein n=1 Tax=Flavobacterium sp. TaxID=239 RepID=UPI0037BFF638